MLPSGIETSRVAWEPDIVAITAHEALGARGEDWRPSKRSDAAEWLRGLCLRPIARTEVEALAEAAGHSWATIRRAAKDLGVIAQKGGFTDGWGWSLYEASLSPESEAEL